MGKKMNRLIRRIVTVSVLLQACTFSSDTRRYVSIHDTLQNLRKEKYEVVKRKADETIVDFLYGEISEADASKMEIRLNDTETDDTLECAVREDQNEIFQRIRKHDIIRADVTFGYKGNFPGCIIQSAEVIK